MLKRVEHTFDLYNKGLQAEMEMKEKEMKSSLFVQIKIVVGKLLQPHQDVDKAVKDNETLADDSAKPLESLPIKVQVEANVLTLSERRALKMAEKSREAPQMQTKTTEEQARTHHYVFAKENRNLSTKSVDKMWTNCL